MLLAAYPAGSCFLFFLRSYLIYPSVKRAARYMEFPSHFVERAFTFIDGNYIRAFFLGHLTARTTNMNILRLCHSRSHNQYNMYVSG